MAKRIAKLTNEERRAIIEASPFDAGWFQGEGFHVFRKDIKEFDKAYVTSLGEIDGVMADDWVIARYLEDEDARRQGAAPRP